MKNKKPPLLLVIPRSLFPVFHSSLFLCGRDAERPRVVGLSLPGSAWERTACEALPRGSHSLEAEPPGQCVPRQSLGTRESYAQSVGIRFNFPCFPPRSSCTPP